MLAGSAVLKWLTGSVLIFWLVALGISLNEYQYESQMRAFYKKQQRQTWVEQTPKNPHMAAHYGTFVFKPANPLSLLDKGISNFSGTFIYLEAHRQNDFVCSPAQNSSSFIRMGEFNISFLLQFAIPLLIISLAAGMFSKEKQDGTLGFMTANSIGARPIFYAKSAVLLGFTAALTLAIFAGTLLVSAIFGVQWSVGHIMAIIALFLSYLLFYWCLTSLSLLVSFAVESFKSAFLISCFTCIFLFFWFPKLTANFADRLFPLPTSLVFREAVRKEIVNGIDGHSMGKREEAVIDSMLKKYNVDSTSKLPVNIDGILLTKSEAYSSSVYDNHFKDLQERIARQQKLSSLLGIFDPFLLIRNISFAISRNSIYDEFAFRNEAEIYRNYYVQELNKNMTLHSKESEFQTYKVGSAVFGSIKDFDFSQAGIPESIFRCLTDILVLLSLLLFIHVLIFRTAS